MLRVGVATTAPKQTKHERKPTMKQIPTCINCLGTGYQPNENESCHVCDGFGYIAKDTLSEKVYLVRVAVSVDESEFVISTNGKYHFEPPTIADSILDTVCNHLLGVAGVFDVSASCGLLDLEALEEEGDELL